ncbi:hypothetical protein [Colwellia sp. UCD-KL20]|uniref:hypothetical protein n=1 Tax=Colwellia sp. UCD-KL20 TaxID=1917165 RepID=UPI0009F954F0|nr:hypothetical protein [Colwellia sp. UCD-KL20]
MYLKNFNKMVKCCSYDKSIGKGGQFQYIEDLKTSGFCSQKENGWIAVFPEQGTLVCQINSKKWSLNDENVDIEYFHDYSAKTTTFSIKDPEKSLKITYKSWWADRNDFEVNPIAASCEDENSEEDILGYIYMLINNPQSIVNLCDLWSKNIS